MTQTRTHPQLALTPSLVRLLTAALAEDLGCGDVTTERTVPRALLGRGELIAKAPGVLCGTSVAQKIWKMADKKIEVQWQAGEGGHVEPGQVVARLNGPMRGLLIGERVALNFLQRLSGIASLTARLHAAAGGTKGPLICDTRKTTPLWRTLERHAVVTGGGTNHRFGLFDMILIKENHARAAGGLREAIRAARGEANPARGKRPAKKLRLAAETRDEAEVRIACEEKVDLILLDNFRPAAARRVIERHRACGIPFEISGGVNERNIAAYARARPDRISIGALTHSAPALDLSLQLYQE